MNPIQIDDRTMLRRIRLSDAEGMYKLIDSQRDYLGRWLPFIPFTQSADDSRAFIESVLAEPEENGNFVFAILVDGEFAGTIGLKSTDRSNLKTEIGYWLGEQYQGRGIISKSARALCNIAFNMLGMNRIQICCAIGNSKSSNIPKRLGFIYEGTERDGERKADDTYHDIEVYSLLKSEFDK